MRKNVYLLPLGRAMRCVFSLLFLMVFQLDTALAQNPQIGTIVYQDSAKIVQSPVSGNYWMHFPRAAAFDVSNGSAIVKKVIYAWSSGKDSTYYPMPRGWAGSVNETPTLNSPVASIGTGTNSHDLANVVKRNTDGALFSMASYFGASGANANDTIRFPYRVSTNNGATWSATQTGEVTGFGPDTICATFFFHRGFIQDANGYLYTPAYVQLKKVTDASYESHRVLFLKSTDGGVHWRKVSTIQYTVGLSYTESSIVRCKDGSILAIMRNHSATATNALKYKRSTDNGVSWGTVNFVPNLPTHVGVDPFLEMMPNGVLVLSYGDNTSNFNRDNRIAYDPNGTGASWQFMARTFESTSGTAHRCTGYSSVFPFRNNQFAQITDRGTYRYYGNDETPTGEPLQLWLQKIDVVFNNEYKNRIDLKSKFHDGKITLSGFTATNTTFPETNQAAAFDASTDYRSSAFASGSSDTYTVDLQKIHRLVGISICLQKGVPQTATISCSPDNVTWSTIKSYTNATHYTVDYTKFSPKLARYVKVVVSGSATNAAITELNLFSSADTFEDFALNKVPYGYTVSDDGFWVSEGVTPFPTGSQSKRALYMFDNDGGNKTISKSSYTPGAKKTLEFKLKVKQFATNGGGCIQFILTSGSTPVYQFAVFPGGMIKYYNGSVWNNVGSGPVVFPLDTFKTVKVVADLTTNKDSVFVNNVLIGTNATKLGTASTISGFRFGSGGSPQIGDKALFDDVDLYDNGTGSPDALVATEATPLMSPSPDAKKTEGIMAVSVSPNPSTDVARVTVKNIARGKLAIYFTNSFGKIVKTINGTAEGNEFETTVPVQDLRLGVYIVTVEQNGTVAQTKLISNKP